MEDYWNKQNETNGTAAVNDGAGAAVSNGAVPPASAPIDEDIDMIE